MTRNQVAIDVVPVQPAADAVRPYTHIGRAFIRNGRHTVAEDAWSRGTTLRACEILFVCRRNLANSAVSKLARPLCL